MSTESAVKAQFVGAEQVPVSNPDNVRAVYANNVGASGTATDFRLFFNELGTVPEGLGAKQTQEIKAVVVLPIATAETMLGVLKQIVANQKAMVAAMQAGKVV